MKRLFLASSIETTGPAVGKEIEKILGRKAKDIQLVFIPTAGLIEDEQDWIDDDRNGLVKAGFDLTDYDITAKTPEDIQKDLGKFDVIHVNGGDTYHLLMEARESGFDKWITEVVSSGEKIYTGSSAGSIICGNKCPDYLLDEETVKKIKDQKGFGFVNFTIIPHWNSKDFKDLYLKGRMNIAYRSKEPFILLNDYQYVKVEDEMYQIVDTRDK